jgi:hypothetical protein
MSIDLMHVASLRAKLWDGGYRPLAVLTGEKAPIGKDWGNRARQNPPECITLSPVKHALNTGILADGLRVFDVDIDDAQLVQHLRTLITERLGETPFRFRRNSARNLFIYRAATGEPGKIVLASPVGKIEILGKGQQFVAFGVHPNGAELEWSPNGPHQQCLSSLPAITEQALFDTLCECAPIIGAEPPTSHTNGHDHGSGEPQADALRLASALNDIPNDGPPNWEAWNRIGMAIWRATGGSDIGCDAWHAWSQRSKSYDKAQTQQRWDHYNKSPPSQIGAGSLFWLAATAAQSVPHDIPDVSILRLNRRAPPSLPLNAFGHEWRTWIEQVAEAACCPVDYVAGPLLASASALIGNARWAQAWPGWEEPPHLWLGSVGDSGDGKSPGADALFRHVLPKLERGMCSDFPDKHREWKAEAEAQAAAVEQWKMDVRQAQRDGHAPPLPPVASQLQEPQSPRLRQNDVTIERVATLLASARAKGLAHGTR